MRSVKKLVAVGCLAASAVTLSITAAGSASANEIDNWYPTYYDCQYAGDVYAQQGILSWFTCNPSNGGYVLNGS